MPEVPSGTPPRLARSDAAQTLTSAYDDNETIEEGIPTLVRTAHQPGVESKRPHNIERRRIRPAQNAPDPTPSHPDTLDDMAMVPTAPVPPDPGAMRPFPFPKPFPTPAAPAAGDPELDKLLTEMEVAQRRRGLAGPVLLFVVLALAAAAAVYLFY